MEVVRYCIAIFMTVLTVSLFGQQDSLSCHNELITVVEEAPFYDGDITEFIQSQIDYSAIVFADSIANSVVFVSFWIDCFGTTKNHQIVKGVRSDLDEEALRIAELIKFDQPAIQKGVPIKVNYIIPVKFFPIEKGGKKKK